MNYKKLINELDKSKMPRHIAIIMDGNGRWAKKHKTKRINGHKEGVIQNRSFLSSETYHGFSR
jgi:undecaprenyl diphosphate synthase